ncbi:MAG TPA: carboxypeptidase-like regulatory domain-containing protein, partial [Thermoplasmata archaeon]|nr:carboxypeptidase-like regulatory domain-containing protein [Thermoplasmata archaeon]
GVVYDVVSRAPVEGAEVRALYNGTTIEVARTVSAIGGAYAFTGLAPTWMELRASAPGYSEKVARTLLQSRESRTLNISLAQEGLAVGVLTGKVIDESGKPVEGAQISTGLAAATTGVDGRFEVAMRAGLAEVEVTRDGFTAAKRSVSLAAGEEKTENFRILRTRGLTAGGIAALVATDVIAALIVILMVRKLRASKKADKKAESMEPAAKPDSEPPAPPAG